MGVIHVHIMKRPLHSLAAYKCMALFCCAFCYIQFCLLLLCAAAEHVEKVVNKNISIVREHNDYCNRGDMVSQYTLSNLHEPSQ